MNDTDIMSFMVNLKTMYNPDTNRDELDVREMTNLILKLWKEKNIYVTPDNEVHIPPSTEFLTESEFTI